MKTIIRIKTVMLIVLLAIFAIPAIGQQRPGMDQQRPGMDQQRPGMGQGQGPGRGQNWQWTEDDVKQRVNRLSQALDLNENQEKKVLDFEMEQYKKNQVDMQKHRGDREKMREIMTNQRELRDKKYGEVLTEEQYKKYKQNQQERMQNRRPEDRPQPQGTRTDRGRNR